MAVKHVDEVMNGTMIDYAIVTVQETQIMDVFEHNGTKAKGEAHNDVPEYEATSTRENQ